MGTSAPAAKQHEPGTPGWLIDQAKTLEKERGALMERIGANRGLLRSLHKVGALNESQRKFVETFYPEKEKGSSRSDEEIEATRKAREAARKG